jgi:purine catabolism regulator
MPLTVREVLDLDVVRRGEPSVVAGASRLLAPVRWVHAVELTDIGRLLRGGELVLSTGIALPDSADGLARYVATLADVGVAGLVIELGRRYSTVLPPALVAAAQARSLPLVELRREVAFIEITEAVHARIIDELLVSRAAAALALGHLLTSQAESLERQAHRTLISALIDGGGAGEGEAAARARAMGVEVTGRDLVAVVTRLPDAGAAVTGPGPAARGTGPAARGTGPAARGTGPAARGTGGAAAGTAAGRQAAVLAAAEAMAGACRAAGVPVLSGVLDDVRAGALLSLPPGGDDEGPLRALAARLAGSAVTGVSQACGSLREVRDAFREAREVADLAAAPRTGPDRPYYRLPDLRLRGLLHLLRDDVRLHAFTERELGPLLRYDAEHGTSLTADLGALLDAGGNKARAAARAHLARPTFYQRLRLIEHVLGISLGDPESRASLQVALLVHRETG